MPLFITHYKYLMDYTNFTQYCMLVPVTLTVTYNEMLLLYSAMM